MFWGTVIKEGKPFKSQQAMQDKEFSALHISQATLPQGKHEGKVYLTATMGKELQNLTVAVLSNDKDTCPLDFYINLSQNVTLSVKGKSEVHLTGYMEPSADEDGMMMGNPEEVDYDSEDDEEELENGDKDVVGFKGNLKEAKKNSQANAKLLKKDESDSEDDDDDEDGMGEYDDEDEEMDSDLMQADMDESEEAEADEEGRFEELSDSDEDDKKKSQQKQSSQKKPVQQVKKEESEDEDDSDDDDEKVLQDSEDDEDDDSEEETGLHDLLAKQRKKQIEKKLEGGADKRQKTEQPKPQQKQQQEQQKGGDDTSGKKKRKRNKKNKNKK